jgi:heterodisulfide reductase subunit B
MDAVRSAVKKPLSGLKIVSYYGCLMVREPEVVQMGEYENPVFMDELAAALGAEPVDWSCKTECCGADLAMTHRDIATEIADRITGMAIEAGADCIMVSCGLCHVNLDLRQSGKNQPKIPILYFSELMGAAMDLPGRDKWWSKHMVKPQELLRTKSRSLARRET